AVGPDGVIGVEAEEALPEAVGDGGQGHGGAGVAGVGRLHGVHGQGADGVDGRLFDGGSHDSSWLEDRANPGGALADTPAEGASQRRWRASPDACTYIRTVLPSKEKPQGLALPSPDGVPRRPILESFRNQFRITLGREAGP